MAEETLASAVTVPEQETARQSPEVATKRRQSSVSEYDSKRRRLSSQGNISPQSERRRRSSPPAAGGDSSEQKAERPRGGREEDRKRGQRLFGGLLGTLSQKPSIAAQRRRADIEKKQQEKLKTQDVEYDELRKRRKEEREELRRRQAPLYEREAMQTRHSNMIAMAHFFKTRAEPVLYYKPWQPRPGDDSIIREQIENAEAVVAREVAEFEAKYPPEALAPKMPTPESKSEQEEPIGKQQPDIQSDQPSAPQENPTDSESKVQAQSALDTARVESDHGPDPQNDQNPAAKDRNIHEHHESHNDDGGEVVEDNEDTVIY
ncbi:unnamed protein product [Penicillium olsonii]|nr:unnamed protein product [Penicillium olsonii]